MKTTKIFLFILLSFFFISIHSVSATNATGDVVITVNPAPIDCVGSWSACSGGSQTFTITTAAANGGAACSASNGQVQSCGTAGYWSGWSPASCPSSCGTAASNQTRSCIGPYGGGADCVGSSTSYCAATVACPINGACGSSNGMSFYSSPTSGYCSSGTYSGISGSGPWTWSCGGSYGGTTDYCSATKAYDAVCSATHYACTVGNSTSNASNASTWDWTCTGINQGTNATCSQYKPVDGGWTAWSAKDNTCLSTGDVTRTQTRSCTNPTPAYGGNNCSLLDGGNSTSNYVVPACIYTVSTSAGAGGTISPITKDVSGGSTTSFTITPDSSHLIDYVTGCGGSLSGSTYTTGAITGACTVSALFKLMTGTIIPATSSCVIALNSSSCNTTLSWSTTNPIGTSAVTATGMTNVNGNSGSQAFTIPYNSRTFYLYNNSILLAQATASSNCTANTHWDGSICAIDTNIVSTSAGAGGSISPTSQTVNYGATATFTITPDSSHLIDYVTGCGGSLSGSTYTTGAITGACTVSALFKLMTGTLTPSPTSCVVAIGSSSCTVDLTRTITNPVGATTSVTSATGTPSPSNGTSGITTFTVPYNTLGVLFELYNNAISLASSRVTTTCATNSTWNGSICAINTNIVSTSVNTGGTISPTSRTVNYGATTTFTVTPNIGYSIGSVSGCSGYGTSTYTTGAITGACTVSVNFTLNTHTLTVNTTGSGSGIVGGAGTYNYGTTQTATETPNTGSIFAGWSGDCNSSGQVYINGNKVCTATFLLMTGTLTPATSSCIIAQDASNCTVPLTWSTTNPVGTSAVTATGMTNVNGNSGSQAFIVPYNARTFYLYNSSVLLAQASTTSSCTTGTSWNGTKCAAPSGTLSASNCTIAQGASSCNTNLIWSTTDPIGTSAVTTPTSITVLSANSSAGTSYVVNYPSRVFYLYNNNVELKNATATASCINGTTWDGSKCAPIIITFSAASTDIAYNTATTLNWSVANATNCTASGGWSGAQATSGSASTGNLTSLTTFTLSCTGLNGTNGTASVTVIVESSGTLTASNCTIGPAQNKCNTTLVWNTYNPLATSAVTTPTSITVLSANSSLGTSYSVDYGTRDFYLYNNGVLLATATARASCEQVWDAPSGVCVTVPTLTSPISNTISALSAKVGATVATLGIPAVISARGVCYSSTMQNPGINNNGNGAICGVDGTNTALGAFTIYIMKILSPNTTYYYRGYATNIAGTGYSPQGSFTTLVLPPEASVVKFQELNNKSQIDYGQSITLIWDSSNAYYGCTMTSNFDPTTNIISSLDPNTANNQITLKPLKTTVYSLICSGEGGTSPASQVQIKVGKITPTFNEF